MAGVPPICGSCDERFAGVRDALAQNFRERGELGAAVAVTIEGKPVVDIWAGWADEARTRPWERDTLVDVFSIGKAMAALCVLMLVERGRGRHSMRRSPPTGPSSRPPGRPRSRSARCSPIARGCPRSVARFRTSAPYDWALMTARARRRGALVGARDRARLPREHLRISRRRDRPARERADDRRVLPA